MVRYTKESLEQLRSRIDIADVIGQHIELKRAGAAYKACCPFHDEKSPSFTVQKGDAHYHCFGCGAHGDAIQFLMQHLKMGFFEAVQSLADRFHVKLEEVFSSSQADQKRVNRTRLKEALEYACRFYQFFLMHTDEGQEALNYLYERGLTLTFISTFRLGLAPRHEGLLRKLMHQEGFSDEVLLDAGIIADRNGRMKEFFLERITFPIQDATGAVIGFSARKIREETFGGKYINTVETELFKKSRVLFGLHHSRKRIAKERQAIIVEGQLDALRLILNGFDFTVAGLGTAFGASHVHELIQLGVSRIFLLLDGDEAGRNATIKIGHLFQKEGIEVQVAEMPSGVDPDLLLMKEGPVGIVHLLLNTEDYLVFLYAHFARGVNLESPAEKNQLLQELTSRIREWNNPIMVHESIKRLAHLANVPEELMGVTGRQSPLLPFKRASAQSQEKEMVDPDRILESDLLRWVLLCGSSTPDLIEICRNNLSVLSFKNPHAARIYNSFIESHEKKERFDFLKLAEEDDEELGGFIAEILSRKVNREKAKELLVETIKQIKERNWMVEREDVRLKIHSGTANEAEIFELVKKFDELKRAVPKVQLI
ncbi:MAG: dnaG [Chlamydiia bacterium]|nr:dnaG [Chlamydiia bacterium]